MDRRESVAHVDARVHLHQCSHRAGARSGTTSLAPPPRHRIVGRGAHHLHVALEAPLREPAFDLGGANLRRRSPRVVLVRVPALGEGPEEHECVHALGIRGRQEDRERAAFGVPEHDRPLAARSVHHRAKVVHPRLEVGHALGPVREAGAALVEAQQPRERAEAIEEVRMTRLLPVLLEMRDEPGHEQEIDRSSTGHLIGDAEPVRFGVPNRRSGLGRHNRQRRGRGCL